jgi:uncharacterized protein YbjT (DUF2867 family)
VILVTGATGKVGQEVVRQLAAAGLPVRALVRDPLRASHIRLPGVEVVIGDLAKPETLAGPLSGAERVFLLSSPDPDQVTLQGNLIRPRAGRGRATSSRSPSPAVRTRARSWAAGTGPPRSNWRPRGWRSPSCARCGTCSSS